MARTVVLLGATWIGVAAVCVLGNAGIDAVAAPFLHRRQYGAAAPLLSLKVALCRVGSWTFVPGEKRELHRALQMLAELHPEDRERLP